MTKRLLYTLSVVVIAILLLCVGSVPQYADTHGATVQLIPHDAASGSSNPGTTDRQEPLCTRIWNALIANWPLVLIGIPTVVVALKTLNAINRQAGIMEGQSRTLKASVRAAQDNAIAARDSAVAAKDNAQALINSERAWLVVEIQPMCRLVGKNWHRRVGDGWASLSDEEFLVGVHLRHLIRVNNIGRTPAHVINLHFNDSLFPREATTLSATPIRSYKRVELIDEWISGSNSIDLSEPIDLKASIGKRSEAINALEETIVVHGYITYTHVFSEDSGGNGKKKEKAFFTYSYSPSQSRLIKALPEAILPQEDPATS